MNKKLLTALALASVGLVLVGCGKEDDEPVFLNEVFVQHHAETKTAKEIIKEMDGVDVTKEEIELNLVTSLNSSFLNSLPSFRYDSEVLASPNYNKYEGLMFELQQYLESDFDDSIVYKDWDYDLKKTQYSLKTTPIDLFSDQFIISGTTTKTDNFISVMSKDDLSSKEVYNTLMEPSEVNEDGKSSFETSSYKGIVVYENKDTFVVLGLSSLDTKSKILNPESDLIDKETDDNQISDYMAELLTSEEAVSIFDKYITD